MVGTTIKWDITGKCNLHCKHCLVGADYYYGRRREKELTVAQKKQVIEKLPETVTHINLLGGEPTLLRQDLLCVIRACAKKNIKITFNTNGLLLDESLVSEIVEAGLSGIVLSIDGPTADSHDAIRGQGTFRKIMTNVTRLLQYLSRNNIIFELTVNTVLNRFNQYNIEQMIDLCNDLNADRLNILQLNLTGNAQKNIDILALTSQELINVTKRIAKYLNLHPGESSKLILDLQYTYPCVTDYVNRFHKRKIPRPKHCCGATTVFGFMDPQGNVYPCDRIAYEFRELKMAGTDLKNNNLLESSFYQVWNSGYFGNMFAFLTNKKIYEKYNPCNRCIYLKKGLCVPCPLYGISNKKVIMKQCLLSIDKIDVNRSEQKNSVTNNLFYFNQYAPKREEIRHSNKSRTSGDAIPKLIEGMRVNSVDDKLMIFNTFLNEFFTLNFLGKLIWDYIDGERSIVEIVQLLRSLGIKISVYDAISLIDILHEKQIILLKDETLSPEENVKGGL